MLTFKKSPKKSDEELSIEKDIKYINSRLEYVRKSFDMVSDEKLIDAIIYEEISLKARHDFLTKRAKELKNPFKKIEEEV